MTTKKFLLDNPMPIKHREQMEKLGWQYGKGLERWYKTEKKVTLHENSLAWTNDLNYCEYSKQGEAMKKNETSSERAEKPPVEISHGDSRQNILLEASHISTERDKTHGDFDENMTHAGALIGILKTRYGSNTRLPVMPDCPGFYAAMDLVMIKISRICCGAPNRDDFIDGCNYLAEAGHLLLEWEKEQKDA